MLNSGHLNGWEYLVKLLKYHYCDSKDEYYITSEEPAVISFLDCIRGWNRIFIDKPVRKEDVNVFDAQK